MCLQGSCVLACVLAINHLKTSKDPPKKDNCQKNTNHQIGQVVHICLGELAEVEWWWWWWTNITVCAQDETVYRSHQQPAPFSWYFTSFFSSLIEFWFYAPEYTEDVFQTVSGGKYISRDWTIKIVHQRNTEQGAENYEQLCLRSWPLPLYMCMWWLAPWKGSCQRWLRCCCCRCCCCCCCWWWRQEEWCFSRWDPRPTQSTVLASFDSPLPEIF